MLLARLDILNSCLINPFIFIHLQNLVHKTLINATLFKVFEIIVIKINNFTHYLILLRMTLISLYANIICVIFLTIYMAQICQFSQLDF